VPWRLIRNQHPEISNCTDSVQRQLNRYTAEFEQSTVDDALGFWADRRSSYKFLAPIAEDLLAAPASQAFVERNFFRLWADDNRKTEPNVQVVRNASILEAE